MSNRESLTVALHCASITTGHQWAGGSWFESRQEQKSVLGSPHDKVAI